MLAVRFTTSGISTLSDPSSTSFRLSSSSACSSYSHFPLHLSLRSARSPKSRLLLIRCKSQGKDDDRGDEFFQASLLLSETIGHYRGIKYGVADESSWKRDVNKFDRYTLPLKEPQRSVSNIGQGVLRRFQNPTVFLKISCEGDFLLPIGVGEQVIETLEDASWEDKDEHYPNQFQFVKNLVQRLGYEVDLVKITKRVSRIYYAEVCLSKPGEPTSLSIDIRPSDAINIAVSCMAPIYVSKEIVTTDAIQIAYGMIRTRPSKLVYDVTLDSPADGPDILAKELHLIQNMNLAVSEERYNDAARHVRQRQTLLTNTGLKWERTEEHPKVSTNVKGLILEKGFIMITDYQHGSSVCPLQHFNGMNHE